MSLRNNLLALTTTLIVLTSFPFSFTYARDDTFELTQNFVGVMQRVINEIDVLINLIQTAMVHIARSVYSLMATAGLLTWLSRYDRRLGRDLIFGSLMLAFFVECALPLFA